jgi:uncharacterized protein (DUF1778 family)
MPRHVIEDNSRVSLRIRPEEKALIMRAAALQHTDLTRFFIENAVQAAKATIEQAEHLHLTEFDSVTVLKLLENPPNPNQKLIRAATDLADE